MFYNNKLNEIRRNKSLIQNETIILKLGTVINKYFLLITKTYYTRRRPMLSKKGRLLYALHTVKTLFRDAGIENAKVEVELKDGTVETIDCMEEIELFITDYINGDNNFIPSEED